MARIAVAYNDDVHLKTHLNAIERTGEAEVAATAAEVAEILGATLVPVREDVGAALKQLREFDLVFNLCEGVLGNSRLEKNFGLALEMLGIPFTGCDPIAVGLCQDKAGVKMLLETAGLPTPQGFVAVSAEAVDEMLGVDEDGAPVLGLTGRYIVKPSLEDAGLGIESASVVGTIEALRERVQHVVDTYRQPALVEEFVDGRELNLAMYLGNVLPAGEVLFAQGLKAEQRVVGWKAKWDAGSDEDQSTMSVMAELDEETNEELTRICTAAYDLLGIDGYCRFDLRRSRGGALYIVDINPNPDIGSDTGFRKALDAAGVAFPDFLNALIIAAGDRAKRNGRNLQR